MKQFFRFFLTFYTFLYRLTGGRIGAGLNVLLLTTTGRKTGKVRTVPLGYIRDNDSYIIIASNSGEQSNPDWYFNLQANPRAEIQVDDQQIQVNAQTVDSETRKKLWARVIQKSPRYANYENPHRAKFRLSD